MDQWEYNFMETVKWLHYRKEQLEKKLEEYPKGWLVTHRRKNRTELYVHTYEAGKRYLKYLSPVRDIAIIEALRKKPQETRPISREIKFINQLIKKLTPIVKQIIENGVPAVTSLPPWNSENPNYRNQLRYQTARGEKVRSKSEKLIADTLHSLGLDYKYEKKIMLNGREIYPDFTIINPLSGQTYFWEHLGLDSEEYKNNWEFKKRIYEENQIREGANLIVTCENDLNGIKDIAADYFTISRYTYLIKQNRV